MWLMKAQDVIWNKKVVEIAEHLKSADCKIEFFFYYLQ